MHGIQAAATAAGNKLTGMALNIAHGIAHGLTGGAMSAAQGGSFADGFIGSAIGAFLTPTITAKFNLGAAGSGGWQMIAARTAVAATVGGTASALSGGKFATGALTAGFLHLFAAEFPAYINNSVSVRILSYDNSDNGGNAFGIRSAKIGAYDPNDTNSHGSIWRILFIQNSAGMRRTASGFGVNGVIPADSPSALRAELELYRQNNPEAGPIHLKYEDHAYPGQQQIGQSVWDVSDPENSRIGQLIGKGGSLTFGGCRVAKIHTDQYGTVHDGQAYLQKMPKAIGVLIHGSRHYQIGIGSFSFSSLKR